MSRTEKCDGMRLANMRSAQGLSQKELATIAGYSERLIRKAESGGVISYSAILCIADALSQNGKVVDPEDLFNNPTNMAKQFLHAFATYESEMVPHVRHFIDEKFSLFCAGNQEIIPFAGEWQGIEGLEKWVSCFFSILMRPQKDFYKPDFLTYENTVVAWGQDWAHAKDLPFPPIWVTQKFTFTKGKLIRFEDLFDTESGSKHLTQAKAKGLMNSR